MLSRVFARARAMLALPAALAAASCGRSAAGPAAPAPVPPASTTPAPVTPAPTGPAGTLPLKFPPRPTAAAISVPDLMSRVYIFADDSMQGRQVGTPGNQRATAYLEREVRRLGLTPGGENGTFFQDLPVREHVPSPTSAITVDGTTFRVGTDFLPRDNRAFPPGVFAPRSIDGRDVVFGGTVGATITMIPPAQAAGKFLVFLPPMLNGQPQWIGTRGPLTQFYPRAAGIAVVALEVIDSAARVQYFAPEVIHSPRVQDSIAAFMYISKPMAEKLLGAPLAGFTPGAPGRTVRGNVSFTTRQLPARNVVAILPGSDPVLRHQYVAIGAHNDHEGIAPAPLEHDSLRAFNTVVRPKGADDEPRPASPAETARIRQILDSLRRLRPARPDSIFNGADDDASGSMAVLEIAEALALAPVKPRRSILFVWHSGEEKGLWGSDFFTEHPTVPRDSIVAQLNVDMVGRGGALDLAGGGPGYLQIIGSRRLSTQLGDIVDSVGRRQTVPTRFDYTFDANGHPSQYYCRSDHYNYARFGIPVAFFSTGGHRDYHQLTDEPQYLDYAQLARVSTLIHDVTTTLANRASRPLVDKPKPPSPYAPCRQ